MKRTLVRIAATVALVGVLSTTARAQILGPLIVFDPSNYAQAVAQVLNLVRQYAWMIRQAQRIPIDMLGRYHGHSVDWTFHDPAGGYLYAQQLLNALNTGDPLGTAYRQRIDPLDLPTDVIARMPASLQRRLTNAYAAIELADSVSALAVDQMGALRIDGPHNTQVAKDMEKDAVSTNDDFHTQTALLNKINTATVLGLRMQDHAGRVLMSTLEQVLVANRRQRDAEAILMNATIHQWRYGPLYGQDLFSRTASNLDTWRQY